MVGKYSIELCNVLGLCIWNYTADNTDDSKITVDISSYMRGVYFIKITDRYSSQFAKIIKKDTYFP